eukprot:CAMPEP_0183453190 /NCGR_PEP_ID=MMETSP0370-20130417/120252_1 /TAXON_ID=268820 /ORGANISM="Peridinium aciculiferum, Strain PAER-2" /LENGTH=67 /DNA_ID=CAMNT_0025644561 /DNA_START=150 /DNA_END=350 /DNA_ORIENTATION=-
MSLCDRFRGQVGDGGVEAVEIVSTSSALCNTWSLLPAYEGGRFPPETGSAAPGSASRLPHAGPSEAA